MDGFKVPTLPAVSNNEERQEKAEECTKKSPEASAQPPSGTKTQSCPYNEPLWSALPSAGCDYNFEVLKSGQIIEKIKALQRKAFWKFGRLPENDIELAHPTISRFHAILQYRPQPVPDTKEEGAGGEGDCPNDKSTANHPLEGWYIYDLDSTHGTFLNKQRIPPKVYIRMRVGHMLRLGASTRSFILQGPVEDEEPESELSVTELRAQRQREIEEAAAEEGRKREEAEERARNEGCGWGMADDADEETDLSHNPYAATNNEELFLDDPKRTLRGYFEREGLQLEYKCDEMSAGSFVCRVELPLDDSNGRPIVAEVVHKGRKKECVVQCALEACRILDRHGVLRQANREPLKRKVKSQDSGSDDDEFWDRTGDVARKKQRKINARSSVTLTYEDLLHKESELRERLKEVEADIVSYQEQQKRFKATKAQEDADLDSFMQNLNDDVPPPDKTEIRKLRLEEQRIKGEQQKIRRLIAIAKPTDLSLAIRTVDTSATNTANEHRTEVSKKQLPLIGKRNQFSKFKVVKAINSPKLVDRSKALASDEEEVEEEEEEEEEAVTEEKFKDETKGTLSERKPQPAPGNNEGALKANSDAIERLKENTKVRNESETPARNYGPALIPGDILEKAGKWSRVPEVVEEISEKSETQSEQPAEEELQEQRTNDTNDVEQSVVASRKRPRRRLRCKRSEVDIDELADHESNEKYAKWVPPENQTGDGFTELNKKYGY